MNKSAVVEILDFFKKTIYLSKALRAFRIIEKALLISAAALTAGEALLVIRKIGKGK